jgi:hypothetical protein
VGGVGQRRDEEDVEDSVDVEVDVVVAVVGVAVMGLCIASSK